MVAKTSILLFIIGIALFIGGLGMPRYRDAEDYERRYLALEGPERTKAFHALRKECLTPSLKFQDYGLTSIALGVVLFAIGHRRTIVAVLPKTKASAAGLGCIATFITIGAQVGSLFLDFKRGEFPHWADSLGIPLSGMPIMLGMLLFWAGIHSLLMPGKNASFHWLALRIMKGWLMLMLILTSLILLTSALYGDFWQILPAFLWISFYFSILERARFQAKELPSAP